MDILILPLILTMTAVMKVESQTNTDIRLMYGEDPAEGAVFMYKNNRWWPICAERWTTNEAKVACKQLDFPYPHVKSASLPDGIHMNVSAYRVWLDGFNCYGYESELNACWYRGWGTCDSRILAGVTCHKDTVSKSGFQFPSKFVWIGMVMFGAFVSFACYKKVHDQQMRALQTTVHHQPSSANLGESNGSPLDVGNQAYPTSPITHHMTAFNSGNNKNTTYTTLPPSQNQHLSSLPAAPEEFLMTTRIEGNLPRSQEWEQDHTPVSGAQIISAPHPVEFAPPPAHQIPATLPLQGFSHYPSQDPPSHDVPPGYIPPPPTYEEATQ